MANTQRRTFQYSTKSRLHASIAAGLQCPEMLSELSVGR